MRPKLRQLQYLIALKDNGSFSLAAEACHVTQSTLSAGIKELEAILNQTLVDRSLKKVRLTPQGEEITTQAKTILDQVDALMSHARRLEAPLTGPYRLGIIPTIAPYLLPRILKPLQEKFPVLEMRLYEDLTENLLERLRAGLLDSVLIAFPYTLEDMDYEILASEPFVLACSAAQDHWKSPIKLDDLNEEGLLLLEDGHCLRDHALQACRLQNRKTRQTFSASSLPTLIQMVANGYGTTLLPEMAIKEGLPSEIRIKDFAAPKPSREIGLAWMSRSPRSEDGKTLAKALADLL